MILLFEQKNMMQTKNEIIQNTRSQFMLMRLKGDALLTFTYII
jgi:hypothetical protein